MSHTVEVGQAPRGAKMVLSQSRAPGVMEGGSGEPSAVKSLLLFLLKISIYLALCKAVC